MLKNRRIVLETTDSLLTRGELSAGYHFCQYNMRNIVGPDDDEWKDCLCPIKEKMFPTPKFGTWIKCSDRLPEIGAFVIGYSVKDGIYFSIMATTGVVIANDCLCDTTHWMPAPKSP